MKKLSVKRRKFQKHNELEKKKKKKIDLVYNSKIRRKFKPSIY